MGKPNRSTSAPRSTKEAEKQSGTQLSNNIPDIFRTKAATLHEETQASQTSKASSPASLSSSVIASADIHGATSAIPSLLDLQRDLQRVALDIKHTLTTAISDLKTDIQSMHNRLSEVEESSQMQAAAIRQVQKAHDLHLPHIFDLHRQVEDLDNRGRRHNIRVRGVPEGIDPSALTQTVCTIFNELLERPADTPIDMERIHRALRPPPRDTEPPRDIVCCLVNFPLKEEILRKARDRGRILYNGADIKLFQDLSQITLQNRRTLRPLLETLRARNIQYRWKFPFCLAATTRGRTALLRTPEDLPLFCEQLDIPTIDLPEWYSFYFPVEPWKAVSYNTSPKAQRHRSRRRRLDPTSPGEHFSRRDAPPHAMNRADTPRRNYRDE